MKLGHKLILAPVITALVVLAVGQLNTVFLSRASEATRARFAGDLEQLQSLSDVQDQVGRMHVDVYRLMTIISSVDEAKVTAVRADLKTQAEGMRRVLGTLASDAISDASLKEEMTLAGQQIDEFVKKTDAAIDLASIDPNTGVAAMQGADEAYAGLAKSLASAKLHMKEASTAAADASRAQAVRTNWLLTLLSLVAAAHVVRFGLLPDDLAATLMNASLLATAATLAWTVGGFRSGAGEDAAPGRAVRTPAE